MGKATYFKSSQDWLDQSTLLIQARPQTTRISTKYSIKKSRLRKSATQDTSQTPTEPEARPIRGSLILKTFDSASGTTLKYKTTKAAEVTRLSLAVGRLARPMASLPIGAETGEGDAVEEAVEALEEKGLKTKGQGGSEPQQAQAGAGGKKKKKGKK